MFESGPAVADPFAEEFEASDVELPLRLEYQPRVLRDVGLTLFLEERVDDVTLVGLRLYGGPARSLRHRHRAGGLARVRF